MPVEFLSDAQAQRYGRFTGEPSPEQLARHFYLDDRDRQMLAQRRGDHNRLGFAVQLGTVRFLGTFPSDGTQTPAGVVQYLAQQLGIGDQVGFIRYWTGETRWDHAAIIKQQYGYREFQDPREHWRLVRWLYLHAWLTTERPSVLFDLVTVRLIERKVLLPGVTVLARLVAQVRERATARLWRVLAQAVTPEQRSRLEQLLVTPPGARQSSFDQLRRAPTQISAPALVAALQRLEAVRALKLGVALPRGIAPGRLQALARYAAVSWAPTLARMPEQRRVATLLAFALTLEASAQDDALDLLEQLTRALFSRAAQRRERTRLRTLRDLDAAALSLHAACAVLLDLECPDPEVRTTVFTKVARDALAEAVERVGAIAQPEGGPAYAELATRYSYVRQFLPTLLKTISFAGAKAGQPVLAALSYLKQIDGQARPTLREAPQQVVNRAWHPWVFQGRQHVSNRRYYTFCVLDRLQEGLRRGDLFVAPSERWGDPRAKLLQGSAWEAVRTQVCRTLGRALTPTDELAALRQRLADAYQRTAQRLPANAAVRIEQQDGRDVPILTGLDKLEEPASLVTLKQQVTALLPRIDLTDLVLEVAHWTGCADAFTHLSEGAARAAGLELGICAVLVSEACNLGLEPVVRPDTPALTRDRLGWIQQNYLRAETITLANARLVAAQSRIPLAQAWGGGEVASADGLRFVVPVRSVHAGPNPKYFNAERGVTPITTSPATSSPASIW